MHSVHLCSSVYMYHRSRGLYAPTAPRSYCSPLHPAQRGNYAVMRRPRGLLFNRPVLGATSGAAKRERERERERTCVGGGLGGVDRAVGCSAHVHVVIVIVFAVVITIFIVVVVIFVVVIVIVIVVASLI